MKVVGNFMGPDFRRDDAGWMGCVNNHALPVCDILCYSIVIPAKPQRSGGAEPESRFEAVRVVNKAGFRIKRSRFAFAKHALFRNDGGSKFQNFRCLHLPPQRRLRDGLKTVVGKSTLEVKTQVWSMARDSR